MIKKITTFIRPYILSLCSLSMFFAVSTVHATSLNANEGEIYHAEDDNKHIFEGKLAALSQQVNECSALTKGEQALLEKLLHQAPHNNAQLNNDTTNAYEAADVFKKAATFAEQGGIWTTKGFSALEKKFVSSLTIGQPTKIAHNGLEDTILLSYKAIQEENVAIVALLKKMQIKAIVALLSSQEKRLLVTFLQDNFIDKNKLPYQAVTLLHAVEDYMGYEYHYDFTCIDECTATLGARREAILPYLAEAKAFFTGKIKGVQYGSTKVVNSLLQLICLAGRADAALLTFLHSHLEGYDLHIEKINRIVEEGLHTAEKELAQKEQKVAHTQQTLAQLGQEKIAIEKKIIQTFLAQIATHKYLQMKMAYFIALLTKYTGREEALEEAIYRLQYAFKPKIERLHQAYVTMGAPASPLLIDKVVNTLLCYLVDTEASDKKVKEIESIQALYTAQFRFNLLETINKSLENKPELKNWLDKLNTSEQAIAIEEIITLDIAETLMELDTFMQSSVIAVEKKQQAIKEILQSLQHVIILTCEDRFNTIRQQFMKKPINELIQQLGKHIGLVTIISFIMKDKGQRIKEGEQDIRQICSQKVNHMKEYLYSFVSSQDQQAGIKQLLQQIQTRLSQQISEVNTQANHKPIQKLLPENQASTVSIGAKVYSQTASCHNFTKLAEWMKWCEKLQRNIQAQADNVLPLLGVLLLILLDYYRQLQRTKLKYS
ncbi:MAG: hypothetical protein AAF900_02200 [Bacteroidota bacterium]